MEEWEKWILYPLLVSGLSFGLLCIGLFFKNELIMIIGISGLFFFMIISGIFAFKYRHLDKGKKERYYAEMRKSKPEIYCVPIKSLTELERLGLYTQPKFTKSESRILNLFNSVQEIHNHANSFPPIKWPELCPCCGEPSNTTQEWEKKFVVYHSLLDYRSSTEYTYNYSVPYCTGCKNHVRNYLRALDDGSLKAKQEARRSKKISCSMIRWAFRISVFQESSLKNNPSDFILLFFFAKQEFAVEFAKLNYNSEVIPLNYHKHWGFVTSDKLINKYLTSEGLYGAGLSDWYTENAGVTYKELRESSESLNLGLLIQVKS